MSVIYPADCPHPVTMEVYTPDGARFTVLLGAHRIDWQTGQIFYIPPKDWRSRQDSNLRPPV